MEMELCYCAWCGQQRRADGRPCPACGRDEVTPEAPSEQPCAYCGARPAWEIGWVIEDEDGLETTKQTIHLCAACDEQEMREIEAD